MPDLKKTSLGFFFAFLGTSVVSLVIGKIPESIALVLIALRAMVSLPCLTQVVAGLCEWSVDLDMERN